mmetsp:Transcript_28888/g.59229  ORF Transcript_28888/g.59229 Transcript_28888/m.59229 type:complete len:82 (+) Transcript_28888:478-723(+)
MIVLRIWVRKRLESLKLYFYVGLSLMGRCNIEPTSVSLVSILLSTSHHTGAIPPSIIRKSSRAFQRPLPRLCQRWRPQQQL